MGFASLHRTLDSEMPPSSPASPGTFAVDDASPLAIASKIDKTLVDSRRFCLQEVVVSRELRVAVDAGSRFHQVEVGDGKGGLLGGRQRAIWMSPFLVNEKYWKVQPEKIL